MKSSYARIVRQLTRISYIAAVVFILSGMVLGAVAKPAAASAPQKPLLGEGNCLENAGYDKDFIVKSGDGGTSVTAPAGTVFTAAAVKSGNQTEDKCHIFTSDGCNDYYCVTGIGTGSLTFTLKLGAQDISHVEGFYEDDVVPTYYDLELSHDCVQQTATGAGPVNIVNWYVSNPNEDDDISFTWSLTGTGGGTGSGSAAKDTLPVEFHESGEDVGEMTINYTLPNGEAKSESDTLSDTDCPAIPDPVDLSIIARCTQGDTPTNGGTITWEVVNAGTESASYTWSLTGTSIPTQSGGPSSAAVGTSTITTSADLPPQTMVISFGDGDSDSYTVDEALCIGITRTPDPIDLVVTTSCELPPQKADGNSKLFAEPPVKRVFWKITNSNGLDIGFTWNLDTGVETGSGTAYANTNSVIFHDTEGGPHTMVVSYSIYGQDKTITTTIEEPDYCVETTETPTNTPETPTNTPETPTNTPETPTGTPDNPPDPTLPVPVTGVTPQIVIPVTGADRTGASTMAYGLVALQSTLFNLGLAFFGLGLVFTAVGRKMEE